MRVVARSLPSVHASCVGSYVSSHLFKQYRGNDCGLGCVSTKSAKINQFRHRFCSNDVIMSHVHSPANVHGLSHDVLIANGQVGPRAVSAVPRTIVAS